MKRRKLLAAHWSSRPLKPNCHLHLASPNITICSCSIFYKCSQFLSMPNLDVWLDPEMSASCHGRHLPWHLAGYVFSAVTKAVSTSVTLLTDIEKFPCHTHPQAHRKIWPLTPDLPNTQENIKGLESEMKLKFHTGLFLCYPPVKTD